MPGWVYIFISLKERRKWISCSVYKQPPGPQDPRLMRQGWGSWWGLCSPVCHTGPLAGALPLKCAPGGSHNEKTCSYSYLLVSAQKSLAVDSQSDCLPGAQEPLVYSFPSFFTFTESSFLVDSPTAQSRKKWVRSGLHGSVSSPVSNPPPPCIRQWPRGPLRILRGALSDLEPASV